MNLIKNLNNYILYLFILILPVFPYSQLFLTVYVILAILIVKIVKIIFSKKLSFIIGSFDIPVVLIIISYFLSTVFSTPFKMNAFISPGTTTLILTASVIYFIVNQMNLQEKKNLTYFLFTGVILYSIMILLLATKVITLTIPVESLTIALFIGTLIPFMISLIFKQSEFIYKFLIVISIFVSVFTLIVSIIAFQPQKTLPFNTSISIAANTLKQYPILGVGSGNYIESFNKYRPFEFNLTSMWAIRFTQGSSFILTNLTENGILGSIMLLIFIIYFVNFTINTVKSRKMVGWGLVASLDLFSIFLVLLSLSIFPASTILIYTLFILLGMVSESKKHDYIIPSKILSFVIAFPMLILIFLASFKIYILTLAEYNYSQGLKSLSQNKAKETYDFLKKAINLNSKVDRYHKALSSVNLGIANSLAQNLPAQAGQNITDTEKEKITLIVQESINEAKASVTINNRSSENWQFLGKTYHLLIPLAKGADQFAIDSYKQATNLDPINPTLRINLGEIYMLQKDYKNAIDAFKLAVLAKEDYPNSYFNLATAYKENNELNLAKQEFTKTLELLDKDSKDFELAKKELDKLKSQE